MSRILLKSSNTAVIISDSPAFKTYDESGYLFAGVQEVSFGFSVERENLKQLGSQDSVDDTINRQPDVKLDIKYNFSPTYANEELLGINYNLDYKPRESILTTLAGKSYNFYLYNHPDQEGEAISYIKEISEPGGPFPNLGEVVSIGNAYLTDYKINFAVGSVPTTQISFDCSNILMELYETEFLQSPAINLESGNNSGVGRFDLSKTRYLDENKYGDVYDLDRSQIETSYPYDIEFVINDLDIGGQRLNFKNHRLNSFDLNVPIKRANTYKLGSDYVCDRRIEFPINASLRFSSLVSSYEAGFISGLINGEELSDLKIRSFDCRKQITSLFYFENLKISNIEYQTLVNGSTNYTLEFVFQIDDEFGLKTVVTEQDIGSTRFIKSDGTVKFDIADDIPDDWVAGDLDGYRLLLGTWPDLDIGDRAFSGCANLGSGELYFPPNLKTIGDRAFQDCISLPGFYHDPKQNLVSIGDHAFDGCYNLVDIELAESVQTLGDYAFANCSGATDIELANVAIIGHNAFYRCAGLKGTLQIPNNTTSIGESAFEDCSGLNGGLYLGNSLTYINPKTFKNDVNLSFDLSIPNNISGIGSEAFYQCSGFNGQLFISENLSGIEEYAFYSCSSLNGDLSIPNNLTSIGNSAFEGCFGFDGSISLGSSLQNIGENAFDGCSSLSEVLTLPASIQTVGSGAFKNCSSLSSFLIIPSGVQSIDSHAFSGCIGITDVYVNSPPSVFIGEQALNGINGCLYVAPYYYNDYRAQLVNGKFQGMPVCYGSLDTVVFDNTSNTVIKSIRGDIPSGWYANQSTQSLLVIGSTCEVIGSGAFENSSGMTGFLSIPEEVLRIENNAFKGCNFIGELIIPDTVEYLGSGVFEGCAFDDYIEIGVGISDIFKDTFKNCSSLIGDLILPETVTSIGDSAFQNCSSLDGNLVLGFDLTDIGDFAFSGCSSLSGALEITPDVRYIGDYAFHNCNGFDGDFSMSDLVTYIGNYAYEGCSNISGSILLPSTLEFLGSGAFKDCSSLNGSLQLEGTKIDYIYADTFRNCGLLSGRLVIPDRVLQIGDNSFNGCVGFTESITITDVAAQSIGTNAFLGCAFDELIVSDVVLSIEQGEFDYFKTDSLKLTLQDGLGIISEDAFSNYAFVGDLSFPGSLSYIGDRAFSGCTSFNGKYDFEFSPVEYIGDGAFYGLNQMSGSISATNNLIYVGDYAFYNNSAVDGIISLGDSITGIGESAFENVSNAYGTLVIPNTVSGLGQRAFFGCSSLDGTLTLSNQLPAINNSTFEGCSSLSGDLVIPDSVLTIGTRAFWGCSSLDGDLTITDVAAASLIGKNAMDQSPFSRLIVSNSVTSIENGEFDYFSTRTFDFLLQEGLLFIDDFAFDGYDFYAEANLPTTLTGIGDSAFQDCTGLYGELSIPLNVSGIGVSAFENCTGLSGNLTLSQILYAVGDDAFKDCINLDGYLSIYDVTASTAISSYNGVFLNTNFSELIVQSQDGIILDTEFDTLNAFIGDLTIGDTVDQISGDAFDQFSFAGNLSGANGASIIGDRAFSGVNFIGDLIINADYVGSGAFYQCSFDGSIDLGESLIIEDYAFYECSNVSGNLDIRQSLQSIGSYSFYNMNGLNGEFSLFDLGQLAGIIECDQEYASSLEVIGDYAFAQNSNISGNLLVPDSVSGLGDYVFLNNSSLNGTLKIGSGITSIGEGVFEGCSSLTGCDDILTIPQTVLSIGDRAFYNCSSLNKIRIGKIAAQNIGTNAFFGVNFNELIVPGYVNIIANGEYDYFQNDALGLTLESGVERIQDKAFDGYSFIGNLDFPITLIELGKSGFKDCDGFVGDLTIPTVLDTVSESLFENCSGFNGEFNLHSDIYTFEDKCFKNMSSINGLITFNDDGTYYFGDECFRGCSLISGVSGELTLPPYVSYIGEWAFRDCTNIINVRSENVGPEIFAGNNAFSGCQGVLKAGVAVFQQYEADPRTVEINGEKYFQGLKISGVGIPQSTFYSGAAGSEFGDPGTEVVYIWDIQEQEIDYFIGPQDYFKYNFNNPELGIIPRYGACWLEIGDRCTGIDARVFADQWYLKGSINLTDNITVVQEFAFSNCLNVEDITFGLDLTTIEQYAFYQCGSNTQVHPNGSWTLNLNNNLKTIGQHAFSLIGGLKEVVFGDSLEVISGYAFSRNSYHDTVNLPNSIKHIGDYAFGYSASTSRKARELTLGSSLETIGIGAFQKFGNWDYVGYPAIILGNLPTNLRYIGNNAFNECRALSGDIGFPSALSEIQFNTFEYTNLTSINSLGGVTTIGSSAFRHSSMKEHPSLSNGFFLPEGVYWGNNALENTKVEKVIIPQNFYKTSYGTGLFKNCTNLSGLELSVGFTDLDWINKYTFTGCTSFRIPDLSTTKISGIDLGAFWYCKGNGLGYNYQFTIGSGVEYIGASAFRDTRPTSPTDGISGLYFESAPSGSLKEIGQYAFYDCPMANELVLPSGLETIGIAAFGLSDISGNIIIPDNISSLGTYVFADTNLESYQWCSGIDNIPSYTFYNTTGLNSYDLPDYIRTINNYAFYNTISLNTSLVLPSGLELIKNYAFDHSAITNIDFTQLENDIELDGYAFGNCPNLTTVNTENVFRYDSDVYSGSYYRGVFEGCKNLTTVNLGNPIGSTCVIIDGIFRNCVKLENLTLPTKLQSINDWNFSNTQKLDFINLSPQSSLTSIGDYNFAALGLASQNLSTLSGIVFPNSLTSIGKNNFQYLSGLREVTFPSSLQTMGNASFFSTYRYPWTTTSYLSNQFEKVDLSQTQVEDLGSNQFQYSEVKEVLLPNVLTGMLDSNFADAAYQPDGPITQISGITFPDSFKGMRDSNFYYNKNIRNITFGSAGNFTGMGSYNFQFAEKLLSGIGNQNLVFPSGFQKMTNYNFDGCENISGIQFPASFISMGIGNFTRCYSLSGIDLTNVVSIGNTNFTGDITKYNLGGIFLGEQLKTIGDSNFTGHRVAGPGLDGEYLLPSGLETMGDNNFKTCQLYKGFRIPAGFSGQIGDSNWENASFIKTGYIDTTDSNARFGNKNWYDCDSIVEVQIKCPYVCWSAGTNNFGQRSEGNNIEFKIDASVISDYTTANAFSGSQGLVQGDQITTL